MSERSIQQRLPDPDGAAWFRAALKTVNAPLPVETTMEDMLSCVPDDRNDMYAAVRILALIAEVPPQTLASIVSKDVFSYQELAAAMRRISWFDLDIAETETGMWIIEMAGFEQMAGPTGDKSRSVMTPPSGRPQKTQTGGPTP